MSHSVTNVPLLFQWVTNSPGNSVRHGCDMVGSPVLWIGGGREMAQEKSNNLSKARETLVAQREKIVRAQAWRPSRRTACAGRADPGESDPDKAQNPRPGLRSLPLWWRRRAKLGRAYPRSRRCAAIPSSAEHNTADTFSVTSPPDAIARLRRASPFSGNIPGPACGSFQTPHTTSYMSKIDLSVVAFMIDVDDGHKLGVLFVVEPERDVSHMWLVRRQKDAGFPSPIFFGGIRFWKLSDLERWEADQQPTPNARAARNMKAARAAQ